MLELHEVHMKLSALFNRAFDRILSDRAKGRGEKIVLLVAIGSYLTHLALIFLIQQGWLPIKGDSPLLRSPIAAVYTPFSFILVYEVYLLVYYLPKSITTYIQKQYEIITLIVIRRLFKDLASLELQINWFENQSDLVFTFDLLASVALFGLLYLFRRLSRRSDPSAPTPTVSRFIEIKKMVALLLAPVLLGLAFYSFVGWSLGVLFGEGAGWGISFKNINTVFFDQFFTVLIMADVLLLLLSFFHTDDFHKVIRNSGFILSTILIRISFSVEGLINAVLILSAVTFGMTMLWVHNLFERLEAGSHTK